jgi:peptidylprolyl isomerase
MTRFLCTALLLVGLSAEGRAQTRAQVHTTLGTFTLELREDLVPITAGNFIALAESGFYDGIIFHRVIDDFIIQGGDPTGTGSGGSGTTIPDEFSDSLSNLARTISMANSGPNTGTSQFFINLVNNTYLDYDNPPLSSAHPVFGEVVDGWPVVLAIGAVPVDGADRPLTDVVMDSVRVERPVSSLGQPTAWPREAVLSPNPVGEGTALALDLASPERLALWVVDARGRLLRPARTMVGIPGRQRLSLAGFDLAALPRGGYFLMLSGERGDVRALRFAR